MLHFNPKNEIRQAGRTALRRISLFRFNPFAREQGAFPIQSAGEAAEFFVRG
jgi:hypothetical protein